MEVKKAIETRRSIRLFKNESIDKDIIVDILNCGRLAPSAKNRQPWYFVVLSKDKKDEIANLMIEYTINTDETEERKKMGTPSSVANTAKVIKQAPILILIFRPKDNNYIIGDNLSIGACVENMCLRATEIGIGSLWIRDIIYISRKVEHLLERDDLELNCALALGIPNQNPEQRPRKELKDIVEWL